MPQCEVADTTLKRMLGLLGREKLERGQGMWFEGFNSVHTFFMRFAIDVVFMDKKGKVIRIYERLAPWRMTGIHFQARSIVELPAGEAKRAGIVRGEILKLCNEA